MNEKLQLAVDALRLRQSAFMKAETDAIATLKLVLESAGENGVSVCPLDYVDDVYIPIAETEPFRFKPISLIRYWHGKLEVFISEHSIKSDRVGWYIHSSGYWLPYEYAHTDTWFMLDQVMQNLEYADGYDD